MNIFVRYGGLSSVRQKGYKADMPSFHSPPARRGIYACPHGHFDYFLLGTEYFDQRRMEWLRDKDGNRIPVDDTHLDAWSIRDESAKRDMERLDAEYGEDIPDELLSAHFKKHPMYYFKHSNRAKFIYEGEIWHHLPCKPHEVLSRKGSWILSTHDNYRNAFRRVQAKNMALKKSHNITFSKDELEVFIEKV